jgi:DNA-binding NtrC family response regulator
MNEPLVSVLLVDDEPMILSALSRLLRTQNYRVLTTTQPTEIISILEKEPVDILISDVDMPRMRGTALMTQVRVHFPEVLRILMTGRNSIETVLQAINEGEVYRFLLKPFQYSDFLSVLRAASLRLKERRPSSGIIIATKPEDLCDVDTPAPLK